MGVFIISEIGVNHGGSESEAHKLVRVAVESGADCTKFQLFKPELLHYSPDKRDMLSNLLLSRDALKRLNKYCDQNSIKFACTAFDDESLKWLLENTDLAFIKIASPSVRNKKLLQIAATAKMRVIISTGMCEYEDIKSAEKILCGCEITFLHCVSQYPCPPEKAKLHKLNDLRRLMQRPVGISDHSGEIYVPLAAVSIGAIVVESHLTMSKHLAGPDHLSSLEPSQFKQMVEGIRILEKAMA